MVSGGGDRSGARLLDLVTSPHSNVLNLDGASEDILHYSIFLPYFVRSGEARRQIALRIYPPLIHCQACTNFARNASKAKANSYGSSYL